MKTARALVKAARLSEQESNVAEERLAEAQAELARQRQVASAQRGREPAGRAQQGSPHARGGYRGSGGPAGVREQANSSRPTTKKLLELADRYEREVEIPLPAARSAAERAARDVEDIRARLQEYQPPTVTVLGGAAGQ